MKTKYLFPLMVLISSCAMPVTDIGQGTPPDQSEMNPKSLGPGDGQRLAPRCRPLLGANLELLGYTCAPPIDPRDPVLEQEILDEELEMINEWKVNQ